MNMLGVSPYLQVFILGIATPSANWSDWDISAQVLRMLDEEGNREAPTHGRGDQNGLADIQLGQERVEVLGFVLNPSRILGLSIPFEPDRDGTQGGCTCQSHRA